MHDFIVSFLLVNIFYFLWKIVNHVIDRQEKRSIIKNVLRWYKVSGPLAAQHYITQLRELNYNYPEFRLIEKSINSSLKSEKELHEDSRSIEKISAEFTQTQRRDHCVVRARV